MKLILKEYSDKELLTLMFDIRKEVAKRGGEDMIKTVYNKGEGKDEYGDSNYTGAVRALSVFKGWGLKASKIWVDHVWKAEQK
jgi:hypothetical protein